MFSSLFHKLVFSFLVVLVIGSGAAYFGVKHLQKIRDERDTAALNEKKRDISITVIEGKRREEVATLMQEKGICTAADFLTASEGMEGTLFPDTYRFFANTTAKDVVAEMTADYTKRTADLNPTPDQLIIASIVEREALRDADRAAIASIYLNRLKIGMKLEADPSVQYAKDSQAFVAQGNPVSYKFWVPIIQADHQSVQSPYNLYTVTGLPPGPIDSPGLESIKAAVNPTKTNYYFLYYGKDGTFLPAKTYDEHLRNLSK